MGSEAPAKVKYEMIQKAISHDDNILCISALCKIAGVSRSGFYAWKESTPLRAKKEENDKKDFEIILEAYNHRGYAKGARSIKMRLLHTGVVMNIKKIRRLMEKYNLVCPIRLPNPYREMARAMKTSHVAKNVVNRRFFNHAPRKILLTDITYLYYGKNVCYLSTILDATTREMLAYQVNTSLRVDFVIETVDNLIEEHGCSIDNSTIIHSDQGCHYTSNAFIQKLKDNDFIQSMSRKGNCWDNAPQESFYGHMKDEIAYLIYECTTFKEVETVLENWVDYYNNERYQWGLCKLAPSQYFNYRKTGIHPLGAKYAKESSNASGGILEFL